MYTTTSVTESPLLPYNYHSSPSTANPSSHWGTSAQLPDVTLPDYLSETRTPTISSEAMQRSPMWRTSTGPPMTVSSTDTSQSRQRTLQPRFSTGGPRPDNLEAADEDLPISASSSPSFFPGASADRPRAVRRDSFRGNESVETAVLVPAAGLPFPNLPTTTTVTVASVTAAVASVQENLVQWRRPSRPVVFREWYISRHCNEQQVRWISQMQHILVPIEPFLVRYFQLWSLTGEAEFYTLFIPTVVWVGNPLDGVQIASLLCMGQYITGTMKDSVCCPRPPCPPLQLRGKRETHDNEYGFPSTHSSHSGVFSYFLYCQLLRLFPQHGFLCWLAAFYYFANVSFSRIYLGMHWTGDLVGGWLVAFICILFHVAFLDSWEAYVIAWEHPPWWAFVLLYALFHVLSMAHATPHDPCPCYVDSMRFLGVMVGSCLGFWAFFSAYGTLSARASPPVLSDVLLTWSFLLQWTVCIVIVFVCKELSSLLAGVALKGFFKFISGVYTMKAPRPLRQVYQTFCMATGLTTRGNERGTRRFVPFTANNSFSFMRDASYSDVSSADGNTPRRGASVAVNTASIPARVETEVIEEPDGYVSTGQVWSLRTHRHWWLWEVHKRSVSYAVTGFVIAFLCQVLLRELFGAGKPLAPPIAAADAP